MSDVSTYELQGQVRTLESADPSNQDSGSGGTIPAYYVVDPGSVDVALTEAGCDAAPTIGPATVHAAAGDRIAVIAYGPSAADLKLLVLAVGTR